LGDEDWLKYAKGESLDWKDKEKNCFNFESKNVVQEEKNIKENKEKEGFKNVTFR